MKLSSLRLQNFQCFQDSKEIPLHDMTIFIGENDCGKTCILRALNLVFNGIIDEELFSNINNEEKRAIIISMDFIIKESEFNRFPRNYILKEGEQNIIKIKKCYGKKIDGEIKKPTTIIKKIILSKEEYNNVDNLNIDTLKELFAEIGLDFPEGKGAAAREAAKPILQRWINENFDRLEKKDSIWSSVSWNSLAPNLPSFEAYLSADYTSPTRLISDTLKSVFSTHFFDFNADTGVRSLKKQFADLEKEIIADLDKKIEDELKNKVNTVTNKKIKSISGRYKIAFDSGFTLEEIVVDAGNGIRPLDLIGEGTKKRLLLAIMEWDKEIKASGGQRNIIRFYDEPDASLHYSAQKSMYYLLKELSERDEMQILINTHSLAMIDRAPPKIVNHIININDKSSISYLQDFENDDIKEFLLGISTITGIKNSIIFFERCFVIIEGDTELNALDRIYPKMTGKSLGEDGVVLINLENNATWEAFLRLLSKNRSQTTLLFFDKDIQNNADRDITVKKLEGLGFTGDFLDNNVILVGDKEFEDIFTNAQITSCLNIHYPKLGEVWKPEEVQALRADGKFSSNLKDMVDAYLFKNPVEWDHFRKPDFGRHIANDLSVEELKNIREIQSLIEKISSIIE